MRFTPSSTARLRTRRASAGSLGSPQTPGPVMRMAPKPRRWTGRSPPILKTPLALEVDSAGDALVFMPSNMIAVARFARGGDAIGPGVLTEAGPMDRAP